MTSRTARLFETVSYRKAGGKTANVVVLSRQASAPAASDFTVTASDTGGALAAATYSYKVTAVTGGIETAPSVAETGIVTTGSVGSVTIDATVLLASYPQATSWKVYGRSAGTELLIATITAPTATYLDTGSVTPDGEQPEATGAIRFRDIGSKTVVTQLAKATSTKQTSRYFAR